MGRRGEKSTPGKPENPWGELKSQPVFTRMTPTGKVLLDEFLSALKLSLTEFLEQVARSVLRVSDAHTETLSSEFLMKLALGQPISHDEIVELSSALDLHPDQLLSIKEKCRDRSSEVRRP